MESLIYRVGADSGAGGTHGRLKDDGTFFYLPIPGWNTSDTPTYRDHPLADELDPSLLDQKMHLDPDFERLSYGDMFRRNERGAPKGNALLRNEPPYRLVFLSALKDSNGNLRYGLIGQLVVQTVGKASELDPSERKRSAHGRRDDSDFVNRSAIALAEEDDPESGRYDQFIECAEWRERVYRIDPELLEAWGGWSAKDGYCHRGGPWEPGDHKKFEQWLQDTLRERGITIVHSNW